MKPLAALIFLVISVSWISSEERFRRWTDKNGRKITAKLAGTDPVKNLAEFELKNGKVIRFPIGKLGERDQQYILEFQDAELPPSKVIDRLSSGSATYTDTAFLNHTYSRMLGRAPTQSEALRFQGTPGPNKRALLIDRLIKSPEFDAHLVTYLSNILRIDSTKSVKAPYPNCKHEKGKRLLEKERYYKSPYSELYREWLTGQIANDRPWNELVTELIVARGEVSKNPAASYLLPERWNQFINPAPIFSGMLGTEITCARCHDHPYDRIAQIDFFRIASFLGKTEFHQIKNVKIEDGDRQKVVLPPDYQYDNGEPHQRVPPGVYFGKSVNLKNSTYRAAFADWLTDESNPRFAMNAANRLWGFVHGTPLIEPENHIPGRLSGSENYELITALTKIFIRSDFRMKEFLGHLYKTKEFLGE